MNKLHSIFLSPDNTNPTSDLPSKIVRNIDSFKECHPGIEHQIYDSEAGRQFIKLHYDSDVLLAFDSLRPLAYKADLLRYCLLYELGGIYADLSLYFHSSALEFDKSAKIFVYRDVVSRAPWIASTSLIITQPKMQVFASCIEKIISNVNNDDYGTNDLCPTGPNLFGATLAATTSLFDLASGEAIRISRSASHSYAYLNSSGDVVAVAIKKGVGLGSLGVITKENYKDLYNRRQIYAHNEIKMSWTFEDLVARGFTCQKDDVGRFPAGTVIYGPYTKLDAGDYVAKFVLTQNDLLSLQLNGSYTIDVCTNFGQQLINLSHQNTEATDGGLSSLVAYFQLTEPTDNLEIRLHTLEAINFKIERLEIERKV